MISLAHDPISCTAATILEQKAALDFPYAKILAENLGIRKSWTKQILQKIVGGRTGNPEYLSKRNTILEKALAQFPNSPILEIGCGFGTRGLTETKNKKREVYIETDLYGILKEKEVAVEILGKSESHHFLPLNVTSLSDWLTVNNYLNKLPKRAAHNRPRRLVYVSN
jgi:hypothetical protein